VWSSRGIWQPKKGEGHSVGFWKGRTRDSLLVGDTRADKNKLTYLGRADERGTSEKVDSNYRDFLGQTNLKKDRGESFKKGRDQEENFQAKAGGKRGKRSGQQSSTLQSEYPCQGGGGDWMHVSLDYQPGEFFAGGREG